MKSVLLSARKSFSGPHSAIMKLFKSMHNDKVSNIVAENVSNILKATIELTSPDNMATKSKVVSHYEVNFF